MNYRFIPILLVAHLLFSGCASFSTTPVTRHIDNSMSGDSNGLNRWFRSKSRPYRGVPVKLRVRTHVDVYVKERYVLTRVGGDKSKQWEEKSLSHCEQPIRLLFVDTEEIYGDQVVITDFKRPASGSIDMDVEFNEQGYFKNVHSKVVDTTITDSTALLTTVLTGTGILKTSLGGNALESYDTESLQWQERVVAYQRFDINAADFEQQMEAFLNHHLNDCNQCEDFQSPQFPIREEGAVHSRIHQ